MSPQQTLLDELEEESRLLFLAECKAREHQHRVRVLEAKIAIGPETLRADLKQVTFITHREAAAEVRKSVDVLRKLCASQELRSTKQQGKREWFISLADWEKFKRIKGW